MTRRRSSYRSLRSLTVDVAHVEAFRRSLTETAKNDFHEEIAVGQAELGTDLTQLDHRSLSQEDGQERQTDFGGHGKLS